MIYNIMQVPSDVLGVVVNIAARMREIAETCCQT